MLVDGPLQLFGATVLEMHFDGEDGRLHRVDADAQGIAVDVDQVGKVGDAVEADLPQAGRAADVVDGLPARDDRAHVGVTFRKRAVVVFARVVQADPAQRRVAIGVGAVPVVDELVELRAHQRQRNRLCPQDRIGVGMQGSRRPGRHRGKRRALVDARVLVVVLVQDDAAGPGGVDHPLLPEVLGIGELEGHPVVEYPAIVAVRVDGDVDHGQHHVGEIDLVQREVAVVGWPAHRVDGTAIDELLAREQVGAHGDDRRGCGAQPVDDLDVQLGVMILVGVMCEEIQGDLPQERLRDRPSRCRCAAARCA